RGAEQLTVRQRRVLRIHGDRAPNRLWATGDRGRDLRVRQPNLVGFNMDRAAVPKRRLRRDRALLTGEQVSAIDKNGAAISVSGWCARKVQDVVCIEVCTVSKTHGLRPRYVDLAAREDALTPHVEPTPVY